MTHPAFALELWLDRARPYHVVWGRLREALSEPTAAEVELITAQGIDWGTVIGTEATLLLRRGHEEHRRWVLLVGAGRFVGLERGAGRHRVELHAPLWKLTQRRNTRKWRAQSTQSIVSAVLAAAGISFEWQLTRPLPERRYVTQYREDDLAFVERQLGADGIFYRQRDPGGIVLVDDSRNAPPVAGSAHFELQPVGGALAQGEPGIADARRVARIRPGRLTVHDVNWKTPHVDLRCSAEVDRDTDLEIYLPFAGYRVPAEGQARALTRLEAERVGALTLEGSASVPELAPGRAFSLGAQGGAHLAGEYVAIAAEHEYRERPGPAGAAAAEGDLHQAGHANVGAANELAPSAAQYANRFVAIPSEQAFRPPLGRSRLQIAGVHTAIVRGAPGTEIHTDPHGRFKAQFHWDREATGTDADSRWLRLLQEPSSSLTLARVGWEVGVGYVAGDPDRPVGLGRHINGSMPPTYAQPSAKTLMCIRSPATPATGGYNEIKLEDAATTMSMSVRAERDLVEIVRQDKTLHVANVEQHEVGGSLTRHLDRHQRMHVAGDVQARCDGNDRLQVRGDRSLTVGSSASVDVGASCSLAVSGNDQEIVGAVRLTVAGSLKPDVAALRGKAAAAPKSAATAAGASLLGGGGGSGAASAAMGSLKGLVPTSATDLLGSGGIARSTQGQLLRTVGGVIVSAGVGGISTESKLAHAELVGGAKITVAAKESISQTVGGPMSVMVGGTLIRRSAKDMSVAAKISAVTVGAAARLRSYEAVHLAGKAISIQGLSSVRLKSAALRVELDPGGIRLAGGDLTLQSDGPVVVKGANVDVVAP